MTTEEKNVHLSAKLSVSPYVNMKIIRIVRIEIEASGWWIHHHTGLPSAENN